MAGYERSEARAWARERLVGVANVTIPTMSTDFSGLNERAIRHDVELSITHGFVGTLACSEVAITLEQYGRFCGIMRSQSADRIIVIHHAVFNTLAENITAVRIAESAGAELVLLGYPPFFHPRSLDDVYAYTKRLCDATRLAVMLFPIPTWGFSRLDPADMPLALLRRLVDECPNVAAIKAEGGMPYIMSAIEAHREFHDQVVISVPLEYDYVPLAQLLPIPFSGTNYSAYYGPWFPRIHSLIRARRYEEATRLWYQLTPARRAFAAVPSVSGGLINRTMWKYQSWLQGYNGGPLPHPTGRIHAHEMAAFRRAQEAAQMNPTRDDDAAFFMGRHPC
ncbi:MAG TPA: dihydrodipicolinate synthase family protein [Steroidobacteraceae bacterium]|nr:dihydrodipicolinate synthase family protein [Steroidobacteraceae bacterium]